MTKSNTYISNQGLMNLNGNVMCAVDTETSGFKAGYHDIIEVAVVPLNADLRPMPNVIPFHTIIRPKLRYPDSWDSGAERVHGLKLEYVLMHGVLPERAADLFERWVEKLELPVNKKLAPLGKNWGFDRGFLEDWLGEKSFNAIFWHRVRDLSPLVLALNDQAEFEGKRCPFPQTGQEEIRSRLKIPPRQAHRALDDALILAECYRAIIRQDFPWSDWEEA